MALIDDWFYKPEMPFPLRGWQHPVNKNFIVGGRIAVDGYVVPLDALAASRDGRGIWRWVSDKVGVNGVTILTDGPAGDQPGIYYNIPVGQQVFIGELAYGVATTNDSCEFEVGYTSAANGGGVFTPILVKRFLQTGAVAVYNSDSHLPIVPPVGPIVYSATTRCITMRVNANDALCKINLSWHGWYEPI